MEQLEGKSIYVGRKIRIDGQDNTRILPETLNEETAKCSITFGQAASMGVLDTGMTVVFRDCVSNVITLEKEVTGVAQQTTFSLLEGVVVKRKDGKYAILSRLRANERFLFQGRFARAHCKKSVKDIVNTVFKVSASVLDLNELYEIAHDNHLVTGYFLQNNARTILDCPGREQCLCYIVGLTLDSHYFNPGDEQYNFHSIAITIDDDNMQCFIKENQPIEGYDGLTTYRYKSPYRNHVEIRGILN